MVSRTWRHRAGVAITKSEFGIPKIMAVAERGRLAHYALSGAAQGFQSLQTLVLTFLVASHSDRTEFGFFSLVLTIAIGAMGLSRAFASDVLIVRSANGMPEEYWRNAKMALGAALLFSTAIGVVVFLGGLAFGMVDVRLGLVLCLAVPGAVMADAYARAFWGGMQARYAAVTDIGSVVLQSIGWIVVAAVGGLNGASVIGIWALGCWLSVGYGASRSSALPQVARAGAWFRSGGDLMRGLTTESLVAQVSTVGLMGIASVLFGVEVAGDVRGAWTLTGPVTTALAAAGAVLLPSLVLDSGDQSGSGIRRAALVSLALSVLASLWCGVVLASPSTLGEQVFGEVWSGVEAAFPGVALAAVGSCAVFGSALLLRSVGQGRLCARIRGVQAFLTVALGLLGGSIGGGAGLAYGAAVALVLCAPVWWWYAVNRSAACRMSVWTV